ncbi:Delta(12)-fatty-acid desaturase [Thalassoglobus neptunius]|uniref:Delta(12)-fatty-acid desaturase n=1 Tax=Thalassoglobus neptunius TaxID=1938619 RepID=A0A5C5VMJ5_9PLAN|nr:fatty acid desaturase [Thalassoglobus neptunius]TWT39864.1 Delta(12)-fatty-acid desaturase [Thalassoglobus neptunius]
MPFTHKETVAFSQRSALGGIAYFLLDAVLLVAALACALTASHPIWQLIFSMGAGLMISLLFVVGHDAGHQSLTPHRWLNNVLGRLSTLPALHPFSLWILVHNHTHHRWTNLSPRDYVWTPLTTAEYQSLSKHQRLLYRLYRSWAGIFFYYFIEFWIKKIMFPSRKEVRGTYKTVYLLDITFVAICGLTYLSFLIIGAQMNWFQESQSVWNALLFGAVIPFAVWNTMMSLVIYLHHTHPELVWYNDQSEWKQRSSQAESAVHVIFPGPINRFFHWIMEHNAHHARPSIPLYHLREAQQVLEESDAGKIIVFRWTPWAHLDLVRRCKLYDYQAKRWQDFRGNYTSPERTSHSEPSRRELVSANESNQSQL